MAKKPKKTNKKKSSVFSALSFQTVESYKKARTSLVYSVAKKGCKKFIFTSPFKCEGKTTTSINVAVSLAQQVNTKVLVIDCDLRRPTAHKVLDSYSDFGLTNYLNFECSVDKIISHTKNENLDFISYGAIPPNPSELLSSESMAKLISELETMYDYIIFDTPPINMVVDVVPLIRLTDGVIMVIRDHYTTYPELNKAVETLKANEAKILGVIVNQISHMEREKKEYSNYGKRRSGYRSYYRSYIDKYL